MRDIPIHCAETVLNSIDGVFLFNRVKEHTDILWADGSALGPKFSANPDAVGELGHFWGVESGLSKMLAVGLAKLEARFLHQAEDLGRAVETAARRLLLEPRVNVVGGLGVVENAYDETAFIEGVRLETPDRFFAQERALLDRSKALLPHLPWPTGYYDLVYVYRAGKDVSGQGVHTKIVGRGPGAYERAEAWGAGMPKICTLVCSTLAGGNAMGRGKFEIVTQRFADAVDEKLTLTNALTSGYLEAIRKPTVVASDRDLLEIGLANSTCGRNGYRGLFMVSTMWMENVWLTETFWDAAQHLKHAQIEGGLQAIPFDADGFIMLPELT